MRNIYFLTVLLFSLMSCSEDAITDGSSASEGTNGNAGRYAAPPGGVRYTPDPTKLQKVIFYPGRPSEYTLNFYPNGLLKSSQNASGAITAVFVYAGNRLIKIHSYAPTGIQTSTYSYDTEGHVAFESPEFYYEASLSRYVDERWWNLGPEGTRYLYNVTADGLFQSQKREERSEDGLIYGGNSHSFYYNSNGNCITEDIHPGGIVLYSYDTHPNPLLPAVAAVIKATAPSLNQAPRFADARYLSNNNVILADPDDPSYAQISYTYNSFGLPIEATSTYYFQDVIEGMDINARYYYQGDVIP